MDSQFKKRATSLKVQLKSCYRAKCWFFIIIDTVRYFGFRIFPKSQKRFEFFRILNFSKNATLPHQISRNLSWQAKKFYRNKSIPQWCLIQNFVKIYIVGHILDYFRFSIVSNLISENIQTTNGNFFPYLRAHKEGNIHINELAKNILVITLSLFYTFVELPL